MDGTITDTVMLVARWAAAEMVRTPDLLAHITEPSMVATLDDESKGAVAETLSGIRAYLTMHPIEDEDQSRAVNEMISKCQMRLL